MGEFKIVINESILINGDQSESINDISGLKEYSFLQVTCSIYGNRSYKTWAFFGGRYGSSAGNRRFCALGFLGLRRVVPNSL